MLVKLLLLGFSTGFSLLSFIGVDYYLSSKKEQPNPMLAGCVEQDPVFHHAFKPLCEGMNLWGREAFPIYTNNLGLRDRAVRSVPEKSPSTRVLFLGDSFTDGMAPWEETFVGIFEASLSDITVLNGGLGSYSPTNYLAMAERLLRKGIDFDKVIVMLDISDIQDEAAYYPAFEAGEAEPGERYRRQTTSESSYKAYRLFIRSHLTLTDFMIYHLERFLVSLGYYHMPGGDYGDVFNLERGAWTYRKVSDSIPFFNGYAPLGVEAGIRRAQTKLTVLYDLLSQHGIPLVLVVYPWPSQLVHDSEESRQVRIWKHWCENKCDKFINLFPLFFAAKSQCSFPFYGCWYDALFIPGDVHFNKAGNELVARELISAFSQ